MNSVTLLKHHLLDLLLFNKEAFEDSVVKRQNTSTGNKMLHQKVLESCNIDCRLDLYNAVFDNFYFFKPLEGVILCMGIDSSFKTSILDTYNDIKEIK